MTPTTFVFLTRRFCPADVDDFVDFVVALIVIIIIINVDVVVLLM